MTKFSLKEKALFLRESGRSIKSIAEELKVSSGSVSKWCRNVKLTKKQKENLLKIQKEASYRGRKKAAENKKNKRKEKEVKLMEKGELDIGKISEREFFISGVALYWGEGFKYRGGSVGFSVGDEDLADFLIIWMEKVFKIERSCLYIRLTLNEKYIFLEKNIKRFWKKRLRLRKNNFQKTMVIRTGKSREYQDEKNYKGTLRVVLPKSVDKLRLIRGWIKGLNIGISN